jgi:hypothetical protein
MQAGDILVIFRGAKFTYVLKKNADGTFTLVGEAYVQGVMYGEFCIGSVKLSNLPLGKKRRQTNAPYPF